MQMVVEALLAEYRDVRSRPVRLVSIRPCDPGGQKDPKDQTIDEQNFLPDFSPEVAVRLVKFISNRNSWTLLCNCFIASALPLDHLLKILKLV